MTTIPPVKHESTGRAAEFDPKRIAALNVLIRQAGVPVLDINAAMASHDGVELAALTDDGVHPNARGYGTCKHEGTSVHSMKLRESRFDATGRIVIAIVVIAVVVIIVAVASKMMRGSPLV